MPRLTYVAVASQEPGEGAWSLFLPAFPDFASSAESDETLEQTATDFLVTLVEDTILRGLPLPPSRESGSTASEPIGAYITTAARMRRFDVGVEWPSIAARSG